MEKKGVTKTIKINRLFHLLELTYQECLDFTEELSDKSKLNNNISN